MSVQTSAINLYSTTDLKNTSDDHIPQALKELGYRKTTLYEDIRLAIGYLSIVVASIVAWREYKLGFRAAYYEMAIGVPIYFLLTFAYYGWSAFVEKGAIYLGTHEENKTSLRLVTNAPKNTQSYTVNATITDASGHIVHEKEFTGEFSEWFEISGFIAYPKFAAWLAQSVPSDMKKTK